MSDTLEARGLANVRVLPTSAKDAVGLVLTDTAGAEMAFAINPEALNALLAPLLGLATKWADETDLHIGELIGPTNALPASYIQLAPGRNATECAVRVFVGKVELTFLISLDSVIHATANLVKQIDPDSGSPAH